MNPSDFLQRLRDAASKAPAGKWRVHYCTFADPNGKYKEGGACGIDPMGSFSDSRDECGHCVPEDAAIFIAMANPFTVDRLAEALQAATIALEKVKEVTGTSTLQWKVAQEALQKITAMIGALE